MSDAERNTDDSSSDMAVDPRLLELLVCPVSKTPLHFNRDTNELVSKAAGLAYPIRDGVPIMLVEEARELDT